MKPENKEPNKGLKTLDLFIDEQCGDRGTVKREVFERNYEVFKTEILFKNDKNNQIATKNE